MIFFSLLFLGWSKTTSAASLDSNENSKSSWQVDLLLARRDSNSSHSQDRLDVDFGFSSLLAFISSAFSPLSSYQVFVAGDKGM